MHSYVMAWGGSAGIGCSQSLDGGYLLKHLQARSLIPKGFCQESLSLHVR